MLSWTKEHLTPPEEPRNPPLPSGNAFAASFGISFFHFSFSLSLSSLPKYLGSTYCVLSSELHELVFFLWLFFHTQHVPPLFSVQFHVYDEKAWTQILPSWNSGSCRLSLSLRLYSEKEQTKQWLQKLCEVMKLCSEAAGLQCNTLCDLSISSCHLSIKIPCWLSEKFG